MSRLVKEKMVERYQSRFRDVADAAVVSTKGVDVLRMTALRGSLRAKGIRAMTVQNRICRRALAETGLAPLSGLLRGPSTLVWGAPTIVELAKALTAEAKTVTQMQIRGGVSGGQVLSDKDMEALSRMPGREELMGRIVATALGAGGRVAGQILAMGGRIVSQIREVEKKAPPEAPKTEAAPAPEAPKADAAPAPEAPKADAAPAPEAPKA
jgi:large subunit ribosomal protein L10